MKLNLTIDTKTPTISFDRISNELMNKWILHVNGVQYRIAELEFYLKTEVHNDTYTHGHEKQKTSGEWYFHGSGIDLTFGNESSYGGILIRAISRLSDAHYTYGPIRVVTELFSNIKSAYCSNIQFGLEYDTDGELSKEKVYKAPRVGLNPKKDPEAFKEYYRHLIFPKEAHKDKTIIYEALMAQGMTEEEANVVWK